MAIQLIPTKVLMPRRVPGTIRRSRLIEFLLENLNRKLLLVTAPAGYGKTTLLVDFSTEVDLPVCWYTLDEGDRDPSTFVAHLIASIRQKFPHFGQRTLSLSESGSFVPRAAAAALVGDVHEDIPEYFVLILDDWHLIGEEPTIRDLLDHFLRYLPEHAHLIIAGRTLPRGSLIRLTAQGAVAGIGASNLRFTAEEVRELLASRFRIEMNESQAARLVEESEGWITGILLTSQAAWGGALDGLIHAAGGPGALYDYLAGEVFERLPPPLRIFLLESAVPRQFTVELCDALRNVPGSEVWIEQVQARSLYVTRVVGEGDSWFRYHHLFRDFLLTRFKRDDPAGLARLHLHCGELLEARHQPADAVDHYLAAGAPARAVRVMNAAARDRYLSGRTQTLLYWADLLPADLRTEAPELLLYQGNVLTDRGQPARALQVLDEAEAGFQLRGDVLGQVRAVQARGWAEYARGRVRDSLLYGQAVLDRLDASGREEPLLRAQALRLVGASYTGLGQWQLAEQFLTQSLTLHRSTEPDERRSYALARVLHDLAICLRNQGRLEEAASAQAESLGLARQIANPLLLGAGLNNAGYDRYLAGDYEAALSLYTEALGQVEAAEDRRTQGYLLDSIAATHRDRGEFTRAIEVYDTAFGQANAVGDHTLAAMILDGLGHAHRLTDDLERALSLFDQARHLAEREGNALQVMQSLASRGIAHVEMGSVAEGVAELERAADELRSTDSHADLGRVLLWLARGRQVDGRPDLADQLLQEVVRLGRRLGCRPFSLAESRRAMNLLEQAAAKPGSDTLLRKWLNDAREGVSPVSVAARPEPPPPRIEVRALGPGQVIRDGRMLTSQEWGGSAIARELLFYLLDRSPARKEAVGADFWPDLSAAKMTNAFHATKYRARRALGVEFVIYDEEVYRINPEAHIVYDVAEFERLLESARRRPLDDAQREAELLQAVNLYAGDYLSGLYSEWAHERQRELRARYFDALGQLVDSLMRGGRYELALELGRRGTGQDYFREELHRGIMRSLSQTGRGSEALTHYRELCRRLEEELGARPAPETTALADQIRARA